MYRAWTQAEPLAVLRALLRQNERRRVLVWDGHRAEALLGDLAGHVFGIRESKGLEYSHVIIVDFFADLPKAHQQAWKWLAVRSGKQPTLPVELVLQLKMLYVAITRCCNNLAFLETRDTPAGKAWLRHLVNLDLAVSGKGWESQTTEIMSADEWLVEGLNLAASADGSGAHDADIEETTMWRASRIKQASSCFDHAGNTLLSTRARLHCKALLEALAAAEAGTSTSTASEDGFVSILVCCLEQGMYHEAKQMIKDYLLLSRRSQLMDTDNDASRVHQINNEHFMESLVRRITLLA